MTVLRVWAFWLVFVLVVASILNWFSGMGFLASVIVTLIAVAVNLLVIEWEDRQPDSFFGPKGENDE